MSLQVRYAVTLTVTDRKEKYLYYYTTAFGAFEAAQHAMFEHAKAGNSVVVDKVKVVPA